MRNLTIISKKYIILFGVFLLLVFPNYAYIQVQVDSVNNFIDYIELEIINKNNNAHSMGTMEYNYPNIYLKKMSITDLLWNARRYKFGFNGLADDLQIEGDELTVVSSVTLYLGRWKIYELNINDVEGLQVETISGSLELCGNKLYFSGSEWKAFLFIDHIRRIIFGKVCMIFIAYLIFFFVMIKLYNMISIKMWIKKYVGFLERIPNNIASYIRNIFFSIIIIYILNWLFQVFNVHTFIQPSELYLQGIVIAVIYSFIFWQTGNAKNAGLASIVIVIFVILSSTHMTTFLSADEVRAITEQLELQNDIFRHWYMQNAHTNYLIMGTLFYVIPAQLIANLSITGYELAKILHWLCGFAIIQACVAFAFKRLKRQNEKDNIILLTGLYLSFLTCPILIQAMQNYNYDMFSCAFALLALIVIFYGYKCNDLKLSTFALIVCSLSLQEKVPVVPLMFFICVAWIDIYVKTKTKKNRWIYYFIGSGITIGIQAIVFMFTEWWVVSVLKAGSVYVQNYRTLANIVYVELKIVRTLLGIQGWRDYLLAFICLWILMTLGSICLHMVKKWIQRGGRIYNIIISVLIIIYEILGVGISFVNMSNLNIGPHLEYFLIHIKNCVNFYPTIFLIISVVFLIYNIRFYIMDNYEVTAVAMLSVLMSVLYTIMGEYNNARYTNIYISGYIVILSMIVLGKVKFETMKSGCVVGIVAITIIEMISSVRYGYKIFFPIWNVAIYQNGIVDESRAGGTLGPIYYDKIIKYCEQNDILLTDINICTSYKARLTEYYYDIPYTYITDSSTNESLYWVNEEGLNKNSFYCIDNKSLENDLVKVWNGYISIKNANPIIEVKYRGVVISRIYKGDQLRFESFAE